MKKFTVYALRVLAVLVLLYGIALFISGIPHNREETQLAGIAIALSGALYFGISYIVEAACIYITKNKEK